MKTIFLRCRAVHAPDNGDDKSLDAELDCADPIRSTIKTVKIGLHWVKWKR